LSIPPKPDDGLTILDLYLQQYTGKALKDYPEAAWWRPSAVWDLQNGLRSTKKVQPLYGYQGDVRAQKAHLIIRREHVGRAANDLGFEKQPDGKYRVWVSEYDAKYNGYNEAWLGKLKQAYGIEKARREARKRGYRVSEQKLDDGRVRLTLRR